MAHLCEDRLPHPRHKGGGFAEYTTVFAQQCYPIGDRTGMIEAAVAEPLACCLHSLARVRVRQGDCVAILGGGLNAQLFLQLARLQGARRVVLVDSIKERLQMAAALGVDEVVDCSAGLLDEIEDRFPDGADVVINTRGSMEFTALAFRLCAIGARLLCYGVAGAGKTVPVEPHLVFRKEIQLIGGRSFNNTFGAAVDLIESRRIQVAPLVTRTVNLERYAEVVASPSGNHIKTVVVPNQAQPEQTR
jgi:L-iditol 2-dehydrogenase